MKEVQAKPKISSKSRVMAVRAEQKYVETVKKNEKPQQEVKRYCDDELIELEEDIQLIEACLNMDKPKVTEVNYSSFSRKIMPSYHFSTVDCISHRGEIIKRKESPGKQNKNIKETVKPSGRPPIDKIKKPISKEASINAIHNTPQRKFIKKSPNGIMKNRSNSMGNLTEINFAYRSLSPYQVSIKRKIENS